LVTAERVEYFVSISGKGGNTEKRADVPVIFFDKGIGLAVQMSLPTEESSLPSSGAELFEMSILGVCLILAIFLLMKIM
jgi:hypothetical protein